LLNRISFHFVDSGSSLLGRAGNLPGEFFFSGNFAPEGISGGTSTFEGTLVGWGFYAAASFTSLPSLSSNLDDATLIRSRRYSISSKASAEAGSIFPSRYFCSRESYPLSERLTV